MTAAEIAAALGGGHRSGAWWRCRCPVHGSRGPTLALRDHERGSPSTVTLNAAETKSSSCCAAAGWSRTEASGGLNLNRARRRWTTTPAGSRWRGGCGKPGRTLAEARWSADLRSRGIEIPPPPCLRWASACRHPSGRALPAMLARIVRAVIILADHDRKAPPQRGPRCGGPVAARGLAGAARAAARDWNRLRRRVARPSLCRHWQFRRCRRVTPRLSGGSWTWPRMSCRAFGRYPRRNC